AVKDRGIAHADRLRRHADRDPNLDRDIEIAMRGDRFLDQRRQRHAIERRAAGVQLRDLGQDIPAALGLFAQGFEVAGYRAVVGNRALEFARDQEDGRERRSQFMGGGGGKAVELGQMLLAGQHQFGGGQRIGELAGFLGDLERVKAGDADRDRDRKPDPEQIDRRQHQRIVRVPRQRKMKIDQRRGTDDRERAERYRQPDRQRGRRNQHRRQKQEGERVFQSAGEEQESGEFDDVERQQ